MNIPNFGYVLLGLIIEIASGKSYEGTHWLGTFAIYALSRQGI